MHQTTKEALLRWWHAHQSLRFLALGLWNTVFGYGAFAIPFLLLGTRIHYLILAALGHGVAVSQAYLTQRHFVFRSKAPWIPEFLRFQVAYLANLAVGLLGLPILVEGVKLHPLVAQALMLGLGAAGSYLLHQRFTFNQSAKGSPRHRAE